MLFSLHKVIFYYATLAFLLISSHPSDCQHLKNTADLKQMLQGFPSNSTIACFHRLENRRASSQVWVYRGGGSQEKPQA